VFGEAFGRYAHETQGNGNYRAFDVPRARLGADVALTDKLGGRVLIETTRSAAPGSLYGVDGDSLVLRGREIYAEAKAPLGAVVLAARLGIVPTLAITPLEQSWGRRVISPTLLERSGLVSPSDVGATLALKLPRDLGEIAVGAFNGEGYNQHEQNDGKNLGARVLFAPLALARPPSPGAAGFRLLVAAENGSLGAAQSKADRYVAGASYEDEVFAMGLEAALAVGVRGDSARKARALTVWARLGPFSGFELVARADQLDPDQPHNGATDQTLALQGGVGWRAPLAAKSQAFDVYLTYRRESGGTMAVAADPRLPQAGPRVDVRMAF
jgi:hypothetical protein